MNASRLALLALLAFAVVRLPAIDLVDGLGVAPGLPSTVTFGEGVLARGDDTFGPEEGLDITPVFPNGLFFGGQFRTTIFVNMNGNITFDAGDNSFIPATIGAGPPARIAPFWADVDTSSTANNVPTLGGTSKGTNRCFYDLDTVNGIITVTWDDVGYFSARIDKKNAFQLRLLRVGSPTSGEFDIEFRYESINWSTGDIAGQARMGFTSGNGSQFFELTESGNATQILELETRSNLPAPVPGYFYFAVRRPTATITPAEGIYTNANPITFTIVWSQPVAGFAASDISVTGGTGGALTMVGVAGDTYTYTVAPTADGPVSITIPAGSVSASGTGNTNTAASRTVISDRTPPVVGLSPTAGNFFVPEIGFTLTANEPLLNFTRNTPQPSNGSVRQFGPNGNGYTFSVLTAADGPLTVTVPAASYSDRAGNSPAANLVANLTVKTIGPAVTVVPTPAGPDNVSPISFAITFSASVTGFTAADLVVANGTVASFAGSGASYTVTVTPAADGLVTLTVPAGSGVDSDGQGNRVGGAGSLYDLTPPTVTITMPAGPIAGAQTAYLQFSEPVSGVTVSATGGTAGAATAQTGDPTRFAVTITPTATGTYTLNVTGASDVAGNALAATVSASVAADTTLSQLAITTTAGSRTATSPIPFTFTFTAAPTGFAAGDVQVANGAVGSLVAASATTFTMNVTPSASGAVTVSVPAGACTIGAAGNGAASRTIIYDAAGPVPSVTRVDPSSGLPGSVVRVELSFAEAVTGFAVGDITAVGGTVTGLTANASSTVFIVTVARDLRPSTYTTITLTAGTFADAVGNVNPAATFLIQGTIPGSGPGRDSGGCGGGMGLAFLLVGLGAAALRRRRG